MKSQTNNAGGQRKDGIVKTYYANSVLSSEIEFKNGNVLLYYQLAK